MIGCQYRILNMTTRLTYTLHNGFCITLSLGLAGVLCMCPANRRRRYIFHWLGTYTKWSLGLVLLGWILFSSGFWKLVLFLWHLYLVYLKQFFFHVTNTIDSASIWYKFDSSTLDQFTLGSILTCMDLNMYFQIWSANVDINLVMISYSLCVVEKMIKYLLLILHSSITLLSSQVTVHVADNWSK